MIRYCYDANNLEGAKILETEEVISAMKKSASMFCKNSGFSSNQLHMIGINNYKIIGNIHHNTSLPVVETCEQYILNSDEVEQFIISLPEVIARTVWQSQPTEHYDMLAEEFPANDNVNNLSIPNELSVKLVSACMDVLLGGTVDNEQKDKKLFIVVGDSISDFDTYARNMLQHICSLLPLQARRNLSFTSYCNDVAAVSVGYKIIFCRAVDAVSFKQNDMFDTSYFAFIDQQVIFPETTDGSFAKYIVNHKESSVPLLSFFDHKTPEELKINPAIYDVLCNILFLKAEPTPEKYLLCRKDIIKFIKPLYEASIIDPVLIKFIFNIEGQLYTKVSQHEANLVLDAMEYFYNNKVIDSNVFTSYLGSVRDIVNEDLLISILTKYSLENDYNQFLLNQSIFPDTLATGIISEINSTTDLEGLLDEKTKLYGDMIFSNAKIKAAITKYLSTAVDFCDEKDSFTMVLNVSKTLDKYKVPDLSNIINDVTGKISQKLKTIGEEKAFKEQQAKIEKLKEQVLDSFGKVFETEDIKQLLKVGILKDCPKINLTKSEINDLAISIVNDKKAKSAMLFPCLSYDDAGNAVDLDLFALNELLSDNKDTTDLIYSLIKELLDNSNFNGLDFVTNNVALYLSQDDATYKKAKKESDSVWSFCVDNISARSVNKRALYLTIIGGAGVLLIVGAAIISSFVK